MSDAEQIQLLLEALGGCGWDYDLVNDKIVYSDEFFALLGYAPNEKQIDTDWVVDNIHPKDLSQWQAAFLASVKGAARYFDCELRYRHQDDYYIWIQTRGAVTERDKKGRALRVQGIVFDISERKTAKEIESRYRLFLDNIPDALSLKDKCGRYIYINRQFESWLGKPSYQIHGKTADEIFESSHEELAALREHELKIWEQGETIAMERSFPRTDDGKERLALIVKFPIFDEAGKILAIGTTNTDITEQFEAHQAIRASELRYRRLFDLAPAVLAESDWTRGKELVDGLRAQGVVDLMQHLIDHPELMRNRGDIMSVLTVNQEALKVYRAKSVDSLIAHMEGEMDDVQRLGMIEDLVNFANGQRRSVVHCRTFRETGEEFPILAESEVYGEDPEDWTKVLLTVRDVGAEEAVRKSEQRYRYLLKSAPVVLCETDWSRGKKLIDDLRQRGVSDLKQHLIDHPELIRKQDQVMKILSVNQEALRVYRADSDKLLIAYAESELNESQRLSLIEELVNFADGQSRSVIRGRNTRLDGEEFPVIREIENYSLDSEDWSQLLLTVRDTSAEEAIRMSEIRYRRLFESAPVAMYESDWSAAKQLMEELNAHGVKDFKEYFDENPEVMQQRRDVIKISSVNAEALRIYKTSSVEDQIRLVEGVMNEEQRASMINTILTFATGKRRSTEKSISVRENGEIFPILRDCELISADRNDWSRVLISVRDLSIEEEAARQLEIYQQELRSLAGKISLAEESERRRISSELHDGTIQNLVLARIHLANLKNSLESPSSQELADSINDLLESSLNETRSLIFEISPPVLYELGLEPAVEWLAEHYRRRTGVEVNITSDEGRSKLSEEVNIVLFQTTRELLVNVAKHAQAKKVLVDWRHDQDAVVLTVEDDGIGFDVYSPRARLATEGGFGLFAVRERLNLLGADFDIQSSSKGTRVIISAPVYSS